MGAKQSKGEFTRNGPIRQSQKKQFQSIKQKIGDVSKKVKKLKGKKRDDEACSELEKKVKDIQDLLQGISADLKTKHQVLFDGCVNRCEEILKEVEELRAKEGEPKEVEEVTKVEEPPKIEEPPKVEEALEEPSKAQVSYDEENCVPEEKSVAETEPEEPVLRQVATNTIERKTKKLKKTKQGYKRQISLEEESFTKIQKIREEMVDLRDEALLFKGEPNGQVYHFLKETFLRLIRRLETIELYDNKQIKHERRTAIDYANESIRALEQIVSGAKASSVRQSLTQQQQLNLKEHFMRRTSSPDPPRILEAREEDVKVSSDDSAQEPVNMDNFKQMLDAKLGRMSRMDIVTVNKIKESREESKVYDTDGSAGNLTTDGSSVDDIDDILHSLNASTENLTNKVTVTHI